MKVKLPNFSIEILTQNFFLFFPISRFIPCCSLLSKEELVRDANKNTLWPNLSPPCPTCIFLYANICHIE